MLAKKRRGTLCTGKTNETPVNIGFQAIDRPDKKCKKSFVDCKNLLYLFHYKFSKKSL